MASLRAAQRSTINAYNNIGVGSPVTQQGTVVITTGFDQQGYHTRSSSGASESPWGGQGAHNYSMLPHELVFAESGTSGFTHNQRYMTNGVNQPTLRVFSSCNGIKYCHETGKPSSIASRKAAIREKLIFVGVNRTAVENPDANRSMNTTTVVAGSQTIMNTGMHAINIGDKVCWDIPPFDNESKSNNVPPNLTGTGKKLFMTVPLCCMESCKDKAIAEKIASGTTEASKDLETVKNSMSVSTLESLLKSIDALKDDARKRVIGVALTRAEPGHPFDILLRFGH